MPRHKVRVGPIGRRFDVWISDTNQPECGDDCPCTTSEGGSHPDLAAHTGLGLAAEHAHPFAADDHEHDASYSAIGHGHVHDHDGDYAALGHGGHAIGDTTGLQTALDGKSATGHGHAQADVTNLVSDLAGKAASGHNHDASYSAAAHNHDGSYAAPHAHPYAADDHTHPGGSEAFPVGSVFIAVVATNPGTLLGYGTWVAIAVGRMLVGFDSGDADFDAAEKTGGAKTVTLTAAQSGLPQHTHTQNAHTHVQDAHSHGMAEGTTDGSGTFMDRSNAAAATTAATDAATATNQNATAVNQNAGPTDAAQAHQNLPPFFVVYTWKRTA